LFYYCFSVFLQSLTVYCYLLCFTLSTAGSHLGLLSFPTRRSSDLWWSTWWRSPAATTGRSSWWSPRSRLNGEPTTRTSCSRQSTDRKSTRLNSSHVSISYAVFCLKKKIYQSTIYRLCVGDVRRRIR